MKKILPALFQYIEWQQIDGQQEHCDAFHQSEKLHQQLLNMLPVEAHPLLIEYADSITKQDFAFYRNDLEMAARIGVQLYQELQEPVDFRER